MRTHATARQSSWGLAVTISLAAHALLVPIFCFWARWSEQRCPTLAQPFNNVVDAAADLDVRLEMPASVRNAPLAPLATMPQLANSPLKPVAKPAPSHQVGHGQAPLSARAVGSAGPGKGTPGASGSAEPPGTVLHIPARCRRVVFVIDRSLSMGLHGGLRTAQNELRAGLEALREDAQFQIIAYNRAWLPLLADATRGLVPATVGNKAQAVERLAELVAEGRTQHVPALQAALRLEPDMIFWLTDADDFRADEVRAITTYNRRHIPICTVALTASTRTLDNPSLRTLAQQTGGTYAALCTLR